MALLLVACHAPTEVEPSLGAKQGGECLVDEHTPKGCCLVDGALNCPDVPPPNPSGEWGR